jgi:hypothetical protein
VPATTLNIKLADESPNPPPPARGKGKSKITLSNDDIPLALLKKSLYGYLDSTGFLSSLEMAAFSH